MVVYGFELGLEGRSRGSCCRWKKGVVGLLTISDRVCIRSVYRIDRECVVSRERVNASVSGTARRMNGRRRETSERYILMGRKGRERETGNRTKLEMRQQEEAQKCVEPTHSQGSRLPADAVETQ
jgi:hypothetical protein